MSWSLSLVRHTTPMKEVKGENVFFCDSQAVLVRERITAILPLGEMITYMTVIFLLRHSRL